MTVSAADPAVAPPPQIPAEIRALCASLAIDPPREILSADRYAPGLALPWPLKLTAKLVLSRLPLRYEIWRRLGLFRHGALPSAIEPRLAVYAHHTAIFRERSGRTPRAIVEIGPGDSVATAILAHANGATATLIDAGDFASRDMAHYRTVAAVCGNEETSALVETAPNRDAMLARLGARYSTGGVAALETVEAKSSDLIFSNAVLEHIPRDEMTRFFAASLRALHADGIASHGIDLHDHLGGSMNHWRFSARVWESRWFRSGGFYTNRLPFSALIALARDAGFAIELPWARCWATSPITRTAIHTDLRDDCTEGDRLVCSFGVVLRCG